MFDVKKYLEVVEAFKVAEIIRKQRLGLASDQTFLKQFIKRGYNETEQHKKMKGIVISEFLKFGIQKDKILVEKKPFDNYKFRPYITIKDRNSLVFIECHYNDDWGHEDIYKAHLYNNIDKIREQAKIIVN